MKPARKRKDSEVPSPGGALVIGISAECFRVKARPWIVDLRYGPSGLPLGEESWVDLTFQL